MSKDDCDGIEIKIFDQSRRFILKENTQDVQQGHVNWWPQGWGDSGDTGPWESQNSFWERQMDCAEMQFGYGQGRRNGNRVAYNKLS